MTRGSRRCIVVSTMAEASFYADAGYDDILYAYPLTCDKVKRCAELSERLSLFHVLVDNSVALQELKARPLKPGKVWHVWLKLDCDNGRAGIPHSDPAAPQLAKEISETEGVELTGIYAHCGNTYDCKGEVQIKAVAQETTSIVLQFVEKLKALGIQNVKSSIGSTPSCSHPVSDMAMLSEVHPGNYVFYDVQQSLIGSCRLEDIAVRVLTRVIGHYPHRNQLLVDCGWAALSQDGGGRLPTGYAIIESHPELKLVSMTQEHGRVEPISGELDFSQFPLGSMLSLMPYHGSPQRIFRLHCALSSTSFSTTPATFMSSLTPSMYLLFGLPHFHLSGSSILNILLPTCSASLLRMCPCHLSLISLSLIPKLSTCAVPLMYSFLILSNLVTPIANLNILNSATSNFASCLFVKGTVSNPYITAGLTTLLYILPFTFAETFLSQILLQLLHPACTLFLTSLSQPPFSCTVNPRYLN
ncbi:D-serine dehydratase isoform X2 [Neoarius graeffei]|nr:D-serine dehydratase isoform X2 [Neoarius graeffei]